MPRLDLYVETTAIAPVTIRVSISNALSPTEERVRTFYQSDQSTGLVSRSDTRKTKGGPEGTRVFALQVSGKF